MDELLRILRQVLLFVLDIIGLVLSFLVRMAQYGLNYFQHSDLVGKLLGLLLLVVVAWAIYHFINAIFNVLARYAIVVVIALVLIIALGVVLDPNFRVSHLGRW
jgi:hypothetical protein